MTLQETLRKAWVLVTPDDNVARFVLVEVAESVSDGIQILLDDLVYPHAEAISMAGCAILILYSGEIYSGVQQLLRSISLMMGQKKTHRLYSRKRGSIFSAGYDGQPLLDETEASTEGEDDDDSLHIVIPGGNNSYSSGVSPLSQTTDNVTTDPSSSASGHRQHRHSSSKNNRKQQHHNHRGRNKNVSSFEMIPEETASLQGEEAWSMEKQDESEIATVNRSNSSPRSDLTGPNAPRRSSPSSSKHHHHHHHSPPRLQAGRLRRTNGPVPAAALKSSLAQVKLPPNIQRFHAVSSATLLKTGGHSRQAPSSSQPLHERPANPHSSSQRVLKVSEHVHVESRRAASLNEIALENKDVVVAVSPSRKNNAEQHPKEVAKKRRSLHVTSREQKIGAFRRQSAGEMRAAAGLLAASSARRRNSDSSQKHLAQDCRLLERMVRHVRPEECGVVNRTIHIPPNTPTTAAMTANSSVLSSP